MERIWGMVTRALLTAALATAMTACDQSVAEDTDGGDAGDAGDSGSATVAVVFGGESHVLGLGDLPITLVEGASVVGLQDVIEAALPGEDHATLAADFVASDGFRPEDREFCATLVPVPWATLAQGYIDPATRGLVWDAALGYPGCMSPRDIAEIEVSVR